MLRWHGSDGQLQTIMVTNEHHLMWKRKEGGKEGRSTHLGKEEEEESAPSSDVSKPSMYEL